MSARRFSATGRRPISRKSESLKGSKKEGQKRNGSKIIGTPNGSNRATPHHQINSGFAAKIAGFQPLAARPYGSRAIESLCLRLGRRAKIGRVHPHALRRAMASHMLQRGANLRVIQDLLGHERLTTTIRYTWLDTADLKKVHEKCHPHEARKS